MKQSVKQYLLESFSSLHVHTFNTDTQTSLHFYEVWSLCSRVTEYIVIAHLKVGDTCDLARAFTVHAFDFSFEMILFLMLKRLE